jgi:hypothetical protein
VSTAIPSLPWEITQSGHYHLESDLEAPTGSRGLLISAPAVTLDLRGFTLRSRAEVAILLSAPEFSLRDGTILAEQLALAPEPHVRADHCVLEDLEVTGGLFVGGRGLLARRCQVRGGTFGIKAGPEARLSHCTVSDCLLGLEVAAGSVVEDCTVKACEEGVYAYGSREAPCRLQRVVVYECQGLGLRLDGPGSLLRCEAHNNGQSDPAGGILAGPAAHISECEAYGNAGGDIATVDPCELSGNRSSDGSGQTTAASGKPG